MEINIPPPDYHAGQALLYKERKRFNVACMGRRFGKTFFGLEQILFAPGGAIDGKPVAWFAPSYKLLLDVWKSATRSLNGLIKTQNKTENRIELITGGVVDFWTLEDSASGRGRKYARIVIDEAAHARYLQDGWEQAISPTLIDYKGEAWFISTPNGENYFQELWKRGKDNNYPDWQSWQLPTSANPFIPLEEIQKAQATLPALVFQQEFLAQFVSLSGALIKPDMIKTIPPSLLLTLSRCSMGVDLAISTKDGADYTSAVIMSREDNGNIIIHDAQRIRAGFNDVLLFVKRMADRWKPTVVAIEQVQYQAAVVQELLRTTQLPVRGVRPDKDKVTRFFNLSARYEQGMVYHVDGLTPDYEKELLSFPMGNHDDMVDAAVHAFNALPEAQPRVWGVMDRIF